MNNEAFQEILQGLLVVAQLKPNHCLYTRGQSISVSPRTHFTCVTRWRLGEDRHDNMDRVERLVNTALAELERLQRSAAQDHGNSGEHVDFDEQQKRKNTRTRLALLADALSRTRHGLAMMRTTYRGDGRLEARVDVVDKFIDAALRGVPGYVPCVAEHQNEL